MLHFLTQHAASKPPAPFMTSSWSDALHGVPFLHPGDPLPTSEVGIPWVQLLVY